MRILTVLLTALTLVGFGGAAVAACDYMTKGQQTADRPDELTTPGGGPPPSPLRVRATRAAISFPASA
jgi:hypothetical protein